MSEGGFFSFRTLVSTSIIKAVYLIGAVILSLFGMLELLVGTFKLIGREFPDPVVQRMTQGEPLIQLMIGIFVLVFGNLCWRFVCEVWILFFSMHELLASIDKSLRQVEPNTYKRMVT